MKASSKTVYIKMKGREAVVSVYYMYVCEAGPDLTDARPQANPLVKTLSLCCEGKNGKASRGN